MKVGWNMATVLEQDQRNGSASVVRRFATRTITGEVCYGERRPVVREQVAVIDARGAFDGLTAAVHEAVSQLLRINVVQDRDGPRPQLEVGRLYYVQLPHCRQIPSHLGGEVTINSVADAREVIVRWGGSLVSVESLREDMTLRSVLVAGYTVFLV